MVGISAWLLQCNSLLKGDGLMDDKNIVELQSRETENEYYKKPSILQVGALFSIAVLLLVFVGPRLKHWDFNIGGLFTEFVLIMLPGVAFLVIFRFDVRKVLRLNKTSFINLFLVFWIIIFALPVVGVFNIINYLLVKVLFGNVQMFEPPIGNDVPGFLISILVIGISAGICEEVLFRGVIQRGFERLGAVKSILITAFLFGLLHLDFQRLFGTFLLGALIGFLVYRSNSIISGMFAHFINNSLAVAITFFALKATDFMKQKGVEMPATGSSGDYFSQFESMPMSQLIAAIVFWGAIFIFSAGFLAFLIYAFVKLTSDNVRQVEKVKTRVTIKELLPLIPGLLLVAFIYTSNGLILSGRLDPETLRNFFRVIGIG